jgi:hypothetical protein
MWDGVLLGAKEKNYLVFPFSAISIRATLARGKIKTPLPF